MKIRTCLTAALCLSLAAAGPGTGALAEDAAAVYDDGAPLVEEEIGEMDIPAPEDDGNGEDTDRQEETQAAEDDGAALIEDGVVSSGAEGEELEQVLAAEAEQEAEQRRLKELMASKEIFLETASQENIREYLGALLAQENPTGSQGELEIGAYIEERLKSFGYTVTEHHFHEGFLNADFVDAPGINIIGERSANSQQRTNDIILVCGHYDSVTRPGPEELLPNDKSSAAALLECARILSALDTDVDVCFLFLSGEEDGSYGSLRFAEHLSEELRSRIRAVIYVGPAGYVYQEEAGAPENTEQEVPYYIGADDVQDQINDAQDQINDVQNQIIDAEDQARDTQDQTQEGVRGRELARFVQSVVQYGKGGRALFDGTVSEDEAVNADAPDAEGAPDMTGAPGTAGEADTSQETAGRQEGQETEESLTQWPIVPDMEGARVYFAREGMASIRIFQDVLGECKKDESGAWKLSRRVREAAVGEYISETETGQWPEGTGQETAEDAAGTETAAETESEREAAEEAGQAVRKVKLSEQKLCEFTDLLAGVISLYMTSDAD